jgi:flagellar hook-basal body complex protein FliE
MFITPITPLGQLNGNQVTATGAQVNGIDIPFKEILDTAVQNLKETEAVANNDSTLLALGEIDDLHTLGINATKAYLAERFVIEIRNRAMEAYSEIMRMNM